MTDFNNKALHNQGQKNLGASPRRGDRAFRSNLFASQKGFSLQSLARPRGFRYE
jgi:hypothetical protein